MPELYAIYVKNPQYQSGWLLSKFSEVKPEIIDPTLLQVEKYDINQFLSLDCVINGHVSKQTPLVIFNLRQVFIKNTQKKDFILISESIENISTVWYTPNGRTYSSTATLSPNEWVSHSKVAVQWGHYDTIYRGLTLSQVYANDYWFGMVKSESHSPSQFALPEPNADGSPEHIDDFKLRHDLYVKTLYDQKQADKLNTPKEVSQFRTSKRKEHQRLYQHHSKDKSVINQMILNYQFKRKQFNQEIKLAQLQINCARHQIQKLKSIKKISHKIYQQRSAPLKHTIDKLSRRLKRNC
jgi:hypothetical protein